MDLSEVERRAIVFICGKDGCDRGNSNRPDPGWTAVWNGFTYGLAAVLVIGRDKVGHVGGLND